ncbi:MAG: cation diffusion facilitator family transporter [Lentimicrobium sp.]|jgi:cobalt-zinc-cadmium efflux system protein|nr:cation diffusion facilitator family transporter [Lentimicrobium sp.]MDD2527005.1 cation diffusion facilitator family transporter [Lentimicrobiaceae bacterium]MDD4598786.1 cation diffusion facilitator family transporter [Lentimicrobiaceae bacterium]MDY0025019.1 cation diffusion facilitator family transporter [Lentimicrobium sp.]
MSHHHTAPSSTIPHGRAFAIGIALNVGFVIIEVIYGLMANSSALLADAGHNASDVLGLIFAWTAAWLATRKPKGKYTYGLRRTTILVSILNALLLFAAMGFIGWDAWQKIADPQPVSGTSVMVVASIGVIINTATALLFMKGQKTDLNIRGAYLHMAADAAVSLGVVAAGLAIYLTGLPWIDPLISFIIIIIILYSTWNLFIDSIDLALDAVPKHIQLDEVHEFLLSDPGVKAVHDLHIWAMSTTQVALTAHLFMPDGGSDHFIADLQKQLHERFDIGHTTFQIETQLNKINCTTDC